MTRLAIVVGIIAALLIGLAVAMRVPAAETWLCDLPVVGGAFDGLASVIGAHDTGPIEMTYRFERPPTPEALAAIQRRVAPAKAELRDGKLIVTASSFEDTMTATRALDSAARLKAVRVYSVVYQSEELDRIKLALRKDEQAEKLGLTLELDPVGYHVHARDGAMMVNPAWAERHHCTGTHYEGTGTNCEVSPRDRLDAYVHGDADLFIDAHPDALALPAGRALYLTNAGDAYELEATPTEIPAALIIGAGAAGSTLELALAPTAADLLDARANAPAVELVAELSPGVLHRLTAQASGLALTIEGAGGAADDLLIASAGPHEIR